MKKYILPLVLLFLSLWLFGCANQYNNVPKSDSIKITKHGTVVDEDQTITITDDEVITYITNNLNSLTLEGMDYIKPNVVIYTLVFYEDSVEVKQVNIKSSQLLSFSGDNTPYAITKGELDLDYIDKLFKPLTNDEVIKQLIINTYVEKYDAKDVVNVDKIYMQLTKDDKPVVPYLIDYFADAALGSEEINGIIFYYRDSRRIEVYYNENSYTLKEAIENDLLTTDNLISIAKIQNENCKLGHSWDEGELTQVPGGGEDLIHTCLICGEITTERVNDAKTYSLSFTGAVEYLKEDISGEYGPTSTITVITEILIDADIEVYANGVKVPISTKNTPANGWYYQFGMPDEDVVVEIRVVTIEYTFLHDLAGFEWVKELDRNDIIKVRYETSAVGIAPGNLVNIEYSTDPADIRNLYFTIILGQYVECDLEDAVIDGGGYKKYDFITNDNSYSILISNDYIIPIEIYSEVNYDELKVYKLLGDGYRFINPSILCNSFLTYDNSYQAYSSKNNTLIGEYNDISDYEFERVVLDLNETYDIKFYLDTSFGRIYVISKDFFYLENESSYIFYKVVGEKNFDFLFDS